MPVGGWDAHALELVRRLPGRFFVVLDDTYTIRWASEYACRIVGLPVDGLCGRPAHEIVHPEDLEVALMELGRLTDEAGMDLSDIELDADQTARIRLLAVDGTSVSVEFKSCNLLSDPGVRALGLLGRVVTTQVCLDTVLDRLGTAAPLVDVLALLVDYVATVVTSDQHRIVRFVDGLAVGPGGRSLGEDPLLPAGVLHAAARAGAGTTVYDDLDDLPATTRAAIAERGVRTCYFHPITAHGRAEAVGAVVSWMPGTTLALGVRDCLHTTARLAGIAMSVHGNADELRTAAMIDSLTGCGNRRQLDAWITDVRGDVGVLVVDLDDFKLVNDLHGHPAGDCVLAEMARRLKASLRPGDLVARAGGDEFVVLIPGISDPAHAAAAADRFTAAMREPIGIGTTALHVTASVGTAINLPGEAMSSTLSKADADLYDVKARRPRRHEISVGQPLGGSGPWDPDVRNHVWRADTSSR